MTDLENKRMAPGSDKDYGFPFVEVTPLQQRVKPKPQVEEKEYSIEDDFSFVQKPLPRFQEEKGNKKTNHLPVLISMVLFLVVILGVLAYFLYYDPAGEVKIVASTIELTPVDDQDLFQESEVEEIDEVELQVPATTDIPLVQETNIVSGELIELTQRNSPAQYYIIVGSLPNLLIAKNESQKYLNGERDVYLIYPFGESRNYRLAIAKYSDLQAATNALERARGEFGESLWVLKY
jgi:hypothetical protein